jgi:ABC-type dipeptide/oligopeptide/nickel transport system ATPase component
LLTVLLSLSNGFSETVHRNPQHPYTEKLLASLPGTPGFTLD